MKKLLVDNLEYEKGYVQSEIAACLNVKTPQTDKIELLEEAAFLKDAGAQYTARPPFLGQERRPPSGRGRAAGVVG